MSGLTASIALLAFAFIHAAVARNVITKPAYIAGSSINKEGYEVLKQWANGVELRQYTPNTNWAMLDAQEVTLKDASDSAWQQLFGFLYNKETLRAQTAYTGTLSVANLNLQDGMAFQEFSLSLFMPNDAPPMAMYEVDSEFEVQYISVDTVDTLQVYVLPNALSVKHSRVSDIAKHMVHLLEQNGITGIDTSRYMLASYPGSTPRMHTELWMVKATNV